MELISAGRSLGSMFAYLTDGRMDDAMRVGVPHPPLGYPNFPDIDKLLFIS